MKKLRKLFEIARYGCIWPLVRYRVAAGVEHIKVLKSLDLNHVLDVGANRGQFALAARRSSPGAQIDSFEPLEGPASSYMRVFGRDPNTRLHPYAISTKKGDEVIHLSARDDSSSLLPITKQQQLLYPGTQEIGTKKIHTSPLAELVKPNEIGRPSLLKIDVQGYELEVLKGSREVLQEIDYVYVECSFMELYKDQAQAYQVIEYLRDNGFVLVGVYNLSYSSEGLAIQGDFLFGRTG